MNKDVYITETGEIELGPDGDLRTVEYSDDVAQSAFFRCKTVEGDFVLQPLCGASLESLIGEVNDETTGGLMASMIEDALIHDGFLDEGDLEITTFPISPTVIMAVVNIKTDGEPVQYAINLDLREGLVTQSRVV